MTGLKDSVARLMTMLNGLSEEAKSLSGTIERLTDWFDREPERLIMQNLDAVVCGIGKDTPREPFELNLVLMSPVGRVSIWHRYQKRPEGYGVLSVLELLRFIDCLKSRAAKGDWIPAVEFIKANRKAKTLPLRPATKKEQSKPVVNQQHDEAGWKLSDFLPALPPHPPLPRGLFKD